MNKAIKSIIAFSLKNRLFIFLTTLILVIWGVIALKSTEKTVKELKTLQDWVIERQFLGVPGVGDVVSFGGEVKTYEIKVNPQKLASYNITPLEVYTAASKSNINVGGDVIIDNSQAYVVRGMGLINNAEEIGNIIV